LTAQAIAGECGIITNPPDMIKNIHALSRDEVVASSDLEKSSDVDYRPNTSIVISGPELITLNEHQWEQLCKYDEIVFARTTPEQKLRIVREFQARDEIVGMTGDGVNDAPSLKAADIGIALGSGSDIAIEAADMVLLESFSAVVEAVQYGRVVFDNLKKTIAYLLPAGSFSEFWPVFTNVIFGLPQVLSSFLMIIIWYQPSPLVTAKLILTSPLAASPTAPPPPCLHMKLPKLTSSSAAHANPRSTAWSTGA
jgi:sodium/potassium-transporting ATPase subunit alpha